MTSGGSTSCPQCAAPVSVAAGRCPFCGFAIGAQPAPPPSSRAAGPPSAAPVGYSPGALHYGPQPPRPNVVDAAGSTRIVVGAAVAGAIVIGAIGAVAWIRASRPPPAPVASAAPPVPTPTATAPSDVVAFADPTKVDASDIYPRVFTKAMRWYSDARLLSIEAGPVIDKHVDLTAPNAKIVYTFFAWKKDVAAAHKPEAGGRLVVTVTKDGTQATPVAGNPADEKRMVDEPTCVTWDAMRVARASGVPVNEPITARYELDALLARGIWRATVAGHKEWERYIDGQNCAIVKRR